MASITEYKALFNPDQIQTVEFHKKAKSETIKMEHASKIRLNVGGGGAGTIDFMGDTILHYSLPIQDIISTKVRIEKKRFGQKTSLVIETANDIIDIEKMSKPEIAAFASFLDIQKEKMVLGNKSKKITFTAGGSTKTCTIYPYSPFVLPDEEIISEITLPEIGFVVTNYRVWKDYFFRVDGISMTHNEYDDAIATKVERRREEDIVGGVEETPSLMTSFLSGMGKAQYYNVSYNKSTHHSSSTESEIGDVVFMKDGKRVMIWEDFPDPNSTVNLINSAKAHFNTAPAASPSSGGEDPIKALKLRFAKGEITKEEFLEMKSMLE